ncbi:hypothetical protein [Streptomyces sp. YIM 130001]|uniref:hypothetical protein n=1 Tax=Streptomyces sp. YIM 130001 TaxID=2259644 RepID=UPI000E659DA0|nr:hypothetical protein [Streptomyces sp. YIM 130001]
MDADQARRVDALLRQSGIPGVVAPENPSDPAGACRVYDKADPATRHDVTADAPAAVAAEFPDPKPASGSTRGFVVPPKSE